MKWNRNNRHKTRDNELLIASDTATSAKLSCASISFLAERWVFTMIAKTFATHILMLGVQLASALGLNTEELGTTKVKR